MNLLVFRHGQAETGAGSDAERALTAAGRDELVLAARTFAAFFPRPGVLLVSPLRRARETADILAHGWGGVPIETRGELIPDADPDDALADLPDGATIGVVSHMPLLGELLSRLLAGTDRGIVAVGTGQGFWLDLPFGAQSREARLVMALGAGPAARLADIVARS